MLALTKEGWRRASSPASSPMPRSPRRASAGIAAQGKKFLAQAPSIHSKLVKVLMVALNAREQDSLFRICRPM